MPVPSTDPISMDRKDALPRLATSAEDLTLWGAHSRMLFKKNVSRDRVGPSTVLDWAYQHFDALIKCNWCATGAS